MTVTVLICTYNRHRLLAGALRSVIEKTEEKPEQVVVVNGGDERADKVVESYMGRHGVDVCLVNTLNRNLATSRNIGLRQCRGEIVAMTDDDAEVSPDWIARIREAHARYARAGAIGGRVFGAGGTGLVTRVADLITFPDWEDVTSVRTLPGVNVSYRREVLEALGEQDETLFRGEDVDFNWRVKQLGYEVLFHPGIKVWHHHRATLSGFLNQHYMYGRAYYLVRRKWPEMYCLYPHRFRRVRDVLKAGHFFVSLFYVPLATSKPLQSSWDRIRAVPLLFGAGLAWRLGMMREGLLGRRP